MTSTPSPKPAANRAPLIIGAVVVVLLIGAAAFAYIWFSGGSGEASGETVAEAVTPASAEAQVFTIDATASEVRFLLDEDLRGERVTVVGTTQDVAGQIAVDFANPANTTVGQIRINMRTIATDNEFRNRAIRGQILQSSQDAFEFATFTPTALAGLPESVTVGGEPFTFTMTGDLTLRDVTNAVTFDVTVTPVSAERLEGSAKAVVMREAYGLTIPSVPGVANVEEEVDLEIDFVAVPGATAEAGA